MEYTELQLDRGWQYATYFLLSILALLFVIILLPSSDEHFNRFFGKTNVIFVVIISTALGAAALWWLLAKYNFVLLIGKGTWKGVTLSAGLATLLGIVIIVADLIIRYPQDMNVPVPQALLFYPSVGFVVEIIFHILPLALLLLVLYPLGGRFGVERVVWLGIFLVAILEPTFQVLFEGKPFTWGAVYTWIHVFAIAILQLYIFRRFDFVSMYSFRLVYYAYWHILWGVIRLQVLF